MTSGDYFDALYAENGDPWNLSHSPYERRKLALLLAALPKVRYRSAFEPGCAIGVTTAALSDRCDNVLAMDGAVAAVSQARARVTGRNVSVVQGRIPGDWPIGPFDLIVLSEVLYYLGDSDRVKVLDHVERSLTPEGDVLSVHWRHPFAEAPVTGDRVHAELADRWGSGGLALTVDHVEKDFVLQVYRQLSRI